MEDGPRSARTNEMSASRRSSRIPNRRATTDALIITGDTPYLPRWLVGELLQLLAVLVQPGRARASPPPVAAHNAHALPYCRGRTRHRIRAGCAISSVRPPTSRTSAALATVRAAALTVAVTPAFRAGLDPEGQALGPGGQPLQEPLPGTLATEDPHITLLDRERCRAREMHSVRLAPARPCSSPNGPQSPAQQPAPELLGTALFVGAPVRLPVLDARSAVLVPAAPALPVRRRPPRRRVHSRPAAHPRRPGPPTPAVLPPSRQPPAHVRGPGRRPLSGRRRLRGQRSASAICWWASSISAWACSSSFGLGSRLSDSASTSAVIRSIRSATSWFACSRS